MHIRWRAVLIGGAAGLLSTVALGLVFSLIAGVLGAAEPLSLGLVVGALLGLLIAGFAAAKFVLDHGPVHGSLAALLTAAIVGADALLRGSGASLVTLAGYPLLAAVFGGMGGYLGRRRER